LRKTTVFSYILPPPRIFRAPFRAQGRNDLPSAARGLAVYTFLLIPVSFDKNGEKLAEIREWLEVDFWGKSNGGLFDSLQKST
jgi:hypothetical protein